MPKTHIAILFRRGFSVYEVFHQILGCATQSPFLVKIEYRLPEEEHCFDIATAVGSMAAQHRRFSADTKFGARMPVQSSY